MALSLNLGLINKNKQVFFAAFCLRVILEGTQ